MWPRPVEVRQVLLEHTSQVSLIHDQDVVQAVSANTPHQSLADCIRTGSSEWRSKHLNACPESDGVEVCAIPGIIIANEVVWSFTKGRRLTQLLSDPLVRW